MLLKIIFIHKSCVLFVYTVEIVAFVLKNSCLYRYMRDFLFHRFYRHDNKKTVPSAFFFEKRLVKRSM